MKNIFNRVASLFMVLVFLACAAVPAFANYTIPAKEMKKGDSGVDVVVLKNMLYEGGFYAGVTKHEVNKDLNSEHFGLFTETFVKRFQRLNSLAQTGIADVNTLGVLATRLSEKGILHNQESTTLFLERVESRASTETKGFIRTIINELRRINLVDLLVTAGLAIAAAAVSAICLPLWGVVGVIAVGAGIGLVANGTSEYFQQKAVSDEIDWRRVGIKALGGAVKGAVCAIPGVGVPVAMAGLLGAGALENLGCSLATTGEVSLETVKDALINGAAQGLAGGAGIAAARYTASITKLDKLFVLPAKETAAVGATTLLVDDNGTPSNEHEGKSKVDKLFDDTQQQEYINNNKPVQQQTDLPNSNVRNENTPGGGTAKEVTPPSGRGAQPATTNSKTSTNSKKSIENYNNERLNVENGIKSIHESGRSKSQKSEASGKIYENAKKYFQDEFKREHNRITKLAKNEKREITQDEQNLLDNLRTHITQMAHQKNLCADALRGNEQAREKVLENSRMTIEQIRRCHQILNQQFCNGLANMYR